MTVPPLIISRDAATGIVDGRAVPDPAAIAVRPAVNQTPAARPAVPDGGAAGRDQGSPANLSIRAGGSLRTRGATVARLGRIRAIGFRKSRARSWFNCIIPAERVEDNVLDRFVCGNSAHDHSSTAWFRLKQVDAIFHWIGLSLPCPKLAGVGSHKTLEYFGLYHCMDLDRMPSDGRGSPQSGQEGEDY